ncbi:thiamine-phosphate kinase [Sphingobium sp. EP60837]|uniref:thiamine-phosphate kinase n=1 Tax=Sphingobium sp. EP60837 TaxID=1855519 RepID=UPI0007DDB6D8|nr:AIR synthase related protein [Sphingobium sp. EP60837]ANI79216.1 Thiamine-phosphate kinase [Sphingobium sp. EP60837]
MTTLADLGEMQLIDQVLLPGVSGALKGDDCALVLVDGAAVLWSIDPCPIPVADLLGCCTPEAWGCLAATINLSDIAACGGRPIGLLASLELPDDTDISFVERFQAGLLATLAASGAQLLGGNVKSSARFSVTGSVLGRAGARPVTRRIAASECGVYVIGSSGSFWAAVAGQNAGWAEGGVPGEELLMPALLAPVAQTQAGAILSGLPFDVACMDCSDGVGSAVQQLAIANNIDILLDNEPAWTVGAGVRDALAATGHAIDNACYLFGDWQLACVVACADQAAFEKALRDVPLTRLGKGVGGSGNVQTHDGRKFAPHVMNKNFAGGYNSVRCIEDLIGRFLETPALC